MAYTEFYVNGGHASASNINGGSSSGAPLITKTNGNWNSATRVFTFGAGDTLTNDMVGHFACVCVDGTTTGAYVARVTAIDNTAKTATLSGSATIGTAPTTSTTARTIRIGGCWLGITASTNFPFTFSSSAVNLTNSSGDMPRFNFKGTYSYTGSYINNGFCGSGNLPGPEIAGYTNTPEDGGQCVFEYSGSGNTHTMQTSGNGTFYFRNVTFKNSSTSASLSLAFGLYPQSAQGQVILTGCKFVDTKSAGMYMSTNTSAQSALLTNCEFSNCGTYAGGNAGGLLVISGVTQCRRCVFRNHVSGSPAVGNYATCFLDKCVFVDNVTGPTHYGGSSFVTRISKSVFHNNTTGLSVSNQGNTFGITVDESIFTSNTTAIDGTTTTSERLVTVSNCGFWNNTTKYGTVVNARKTVINCFDFTAIPYADAANGDYRTAATTGRNRLDGTLTNSSKTKTTRIMEDIGIGPTNPHYNGK